MGEEDRGGLPDLDRKSGSGLRDHLEASGLSGSGWYFDPDSRDEIPTFSPTFRENWPKRVDLTRLLSLKSRIVGESRDIPTLGSKIGLRVGISRL